MLKKFSKLGQAFVLPISVLPIAGLLLGLGSALSTEPAISALPFLQANWLQVVLAFMVIAGKMIISFLPLLFTVGVSTGLADGDQGTAAVAGISSYAVFIGTISAAVQISGTKQYINPGVIGAIFLGILVAYLHNKFRKVQLPQYLSFFGGSRFIPIISSLCALLMGVFFYFVWPFFNQGLVVLGDWFNKLGAFGTFVYGFILRLSGGVGVHHAIYPLFWYSALGGTETVAGLNVAGAQNIYFAQLADPNFSGLFTEGTRFFAGRFTTMMFGLPAAALAMYHSIPKENRKANAKFYKDAALTSFSNGITEPIEYTFMTKLPKLYLVHSVLDGLAFMFTDLLEIRIANTFSGGLIDFLIFGPLQGNSQTNWIRIIPLGLIWAVIYYLVFRFVLSKNEIDLPGSKVEEIGATKTLANDENPEESIKQTAAIILEGLGTADNIASIRACATRLRVQLHDNSRMDKAKLESTKPVAVLEVDGGVQVIYGAKSNIYYAEIEELMNED